MNIISSAIAPMAVFVSAVATAANTYYVSTTGAANATGTEEDPFDAVEKAVAVATADNDTVLLEAGEYYIGLPLQSSTKGLKMMSKSGLRDVVIDAAGSGPIVQFTGNASYVAGITFRNGAGSTTSVDLHGTYSMASNVCVRDCHIIATTAVEGGGMYVHNNGWVRDSLFVNCVLDTYENLGLQLRGGGLCTGNSSVYGTTVSNCMVRSRCDVTTHQLVGGGMYVSSGQVEDCHFYDCVATNTDNTAVNPGTKFRGGFGGGLYFRRYSDAYPACELRRCTFSGNYACYQSAGAHVYGSGSVIEDCVFTNNTLTPIQTSYAGCGSALVVEAGANAKVARCRFLGNRILGAVSSSGGGAVAFSGSATANAEMHDCDIIGNSGNYASGISFASCGSTLVSNCLFRANTAANDSGAVFYSLKGDGVLVADCLITDNIGGGFGTVLYGSQGATAVNAYAVKFRNCLVSGNERLSGLSSETALFYWWPTGSHIAALEIENCTIAGNLTAANNSYAITGRSSSLGGDQIKVRGSVVWGNGSTGLLNFKGTTISTAEGLITYTYTTGNVSDSENDHNVQSADDPGFMNAANGDYRPASASSALVTMQLPAAPWMHISGEYGTVGCFAFRPKLGAVLIFK